MIDPIFMPGFLFSLFGFAALILGFFTFLYFFFTREKKHQNEFRKLEKRLNLLASSSIGMGEKVVQLEMRLRQQISNQGFLKDTEGQFSYTQALKLIEEGVDHSLVSMNSGLSDSEVKLMQLLHNSRDHQTASNVENR